MTQTITVKLLDSENAVLKEVDKKQCFFVGKAGEATNAVFEKAYEISHVDWPKNVEASFEIGSRKFKNLSYSTGRSIAKANGAYHIKKHPDGTMFLCLNLEYPAHDSYDKMYACRFQRIMYRENNEVVVIQAKYGSVVPKINVYIGAKETVPFMERLLKSLDENDSESLTYLTLMSRCVAQKYRLIDTPAEKLEQSVIYNALSGACFLASYGIFKFREKIRSYDVLKIIADNICGKCLRDWFDTPPKKRYDVLDDIIHYIRRLKRDKTVPLSEKEKLICHAVSRWVDSEVFTEVYAVCLVLLKFLAENDVNDVHELKNVATSAGFFSSTMMADTVDGLSPKRLDGEAKSVFFSIVGEDVSQAKQRLEQALRTYHAGSNLLFDMACTVAPPASTGGVPQEKKVFVSAVEKTALCAGANAVMAYQKQLGGHSYKTKADERQIMLDVCNRMGALCGMSAVPLQLQAPMSEMVENLIVFYLKAEIDRLRSGANRDADKVLHEAVPETIFVHVYVLTYLCLVLIASSKAETDALYDMLSRAAEEPQLLLKPETIQPLLIEAKHRYGTMCCIGIMEMMADAY